jgi:hypothetical protein
MQYHNEIALKYTEHIAMYFSEGHLVIIRSKGYMVR